VENAQTYERKRERERERERRTVLQTVLIQLSITLQKVINIKGCEIIKLPKRKRNKQFQATLLWFGWGLPPKGSVMEAWGPV
jgi:hypothetical protein